MVKNIIALALLGLLICSAWVIWRMPANSPRVSQIRFTLPGHPDAKPRLWRVVTRRMVWKQAAAAMQKRLRESGLRVVPIVRREAVEVHAFNDIRSFASRDAAERARDEWEKHGFEANVITGKGRFGVALGRVYLDAYAQQLREQLEKKGRKYHYDRHLVNIRTWRFTFPAASHAQALELWRRVQKLGVADPALMPETQFKRLFGKTGQDAERAE